MKFTVLQCIESVPRQEEGSTGKYPHEGEGVPETECWYFSVLLESSQGTNIIQGPRDLDKYKSSE